MLLLDAWFEICTFDRTQDVREYIDLNMHWLVVAAIC